jgi:hypothetical protein
MGYFEMVNGHTYIKMGGVPNREWTDLVSRTSTRHDHQFRMIDVSKQYKIPGPKPFPGKYAETDTLRHLQLHVMRELCRCGMEQMAYLPHPHTNTMINVVMAPQAFALAMKHVKTTINDLRSNHYDRWDHNNETYFKDMVTNSLKPKLLEKIQGLHNQNDHPLEIFLKAVTVRRIMTDAQVEKVRMQIKQCKIENFKAMDVKTATKTLLSQCDLLAEVREYDPLLLVSFLKSLHMCTMQKASVYN